MKHFNLCNMTTRFFSFGLVVACLQMSSRGQFHQADSDQINSYNIMADLLHGGSVAPECRRLIELNVLNWDVGVCSRLEIYNDYLLLVACNESEINLLNGSACEAFNTTPETTTIKLFTWNHVYTSVVPPSTPRSDVFPQDTTGLVDSSNPTPPMVGTTSTVVATYTTDHNQILESIAYNVKTLDCRTLVTSVYNTVNDVSKVCALLTVFKGFLEKKCSNSEMALIERTFCNDGATYASGIVPSDGPSATAATATASISDHATALTYGEVLGVVVSGLTPRCRATMRVEFESLISTTGCEILEASGDQILGNLICTREDYEKLYQVVCRKNLNIETIKADGTRMSRAVNVINTKLSKGCRDVVAPEIHGRSDLEYICTKFKLAGPSLVRLGTCSEFECGIVQSEICYQSEGQTVRVNGVKRINASILTLSLVFCIKAVVLERYIIADLINPGVR